MESGPFQFLVGPEKKRFTIHSSVVTHQSEPLAALVNGAFKEAKDQSAIWDEVDEETFIRFSQFLYTGTYEGAESQKREVVEQAVVVSDNVADNEEVENSGAPTLVAKKRPKKQSLRVSPSFEPLRGKELLWNKFCNLYPTPQYQSTVQDNGADDDYTEVFLSHAKLYVFADYYCIKSLEELALRKLRQVLARYILYPNGASDIVQLLDYCFHNTADKGDLSDPLRTLVCRYTACRVDELWENEEFRQLFDTLPGFSRALFKEVLGRLD